MHYSRDHVFIHKKYFDFQIWETCKVSLLEKECTQVFERPEVSTSKLSNQISLTDPCLELLSAFLILHFQIIWSRAVCLRQLKTLPMQIPYLLGCKPIGVSYRPSLISPAKIVSLPCSGVTPIGISYLPSLISPTFATLVFFS